MTLRLTRYLLIPFICLGLWARSAAALELIEPAYSRPLPPGQSTAVVYLSIKNTGAKAVQLKKVASTLARSAEFHRHIHEDGVMRMRRLDGITIAPGEILQFQPGGYHIMLFGLEQPLRVGDRFTVQIGADEGAAMTVDVEVKAY